MARAVVVEVAVPVARAVATAVARVVTRTIARKVATAHHLPRLISSYLAGDNTSSKKLPATKDSTV